MSATDLVEGTSTISSPIGEMQVLPDVCRPKRSEVARAIRDEACQMGVQCGRRKADQLVDMLLKAAGLVRESGYKEMYILSDDEIEGLHMILYAIMPDDVVNPPAGSAHDLINRYVIRDSEFSVVHTTDRSRGQARYCAVTVALNNI